MGLNLLYRIFNIVYWFVYTGVSALIVVLSYHRIMISIKKWIFSIIILMCLTPESFAQIDNPFGQVIEIQTRFHSFVGKPIWSLVVRDVDNNQNVPYIFRIHHGAN